MFMVVFNDLNVCSLGDVVHDMTLAKDVCPPLNTIINSRNLDVLFEEVNM